MNCIDCIWAVQLDPAIQCEKASPEIRMCNRFERKYKSIQQQVQEMLEG